MFLPTTIAKNILFCSDNGMLIVMDIVAQVCYGSLVDVDTTLGGRRSVRLTWLWSIDPLPQTCTVCRGNILCEKSYKNLKHYLCVNMHRRIESKSSLNGACVRAYY